MLNSLNETITYWTISGNDGTGVTYSTGTAIYARVATHSEISVDDQGKELRTRFAVYAETLIPEKSYIFFGDAEGQAAPVPGSREVVATSENKSMSDLRRMLV